MAKSLAVNVGVNKNRKWGGFRAPIFSNGYFEFMHIPWKVEYGEEPKDQKYRNYEFCEKCVPQHLWNRSYVESPSFRIKTYASSEGATVANKAIESLREKEDFLLFYATLQFKGEEERREHWINPNWGAYVVGLFKIDFVIPRSKIIFEDYAIEAFQEYDFYKVLLNQPNPFNKTPWVKGIEEESGLLEKAVPLSSPEDPERWSDLACKLFRTSTGRRLDVNQKAKFNWVLKCEDACLDELLTRCALRD